MAFRDFWRADRERFGGDRNRDRWRSTGSEWRDAGRERGFGGAGRNDERYGETGRDREGRDYGSAGWSPGGEYYSDRSRGYYGGREDSPREGPRSQRADEGYGRGEWGIEEEGEGEREARRWAGVERAWGEEGRHPYGDRDYYGAFGRDLDYGRRGAYGYGGYGGEHRTGAYGDGTQQYRGKGPRGYRRSDERIREDVCDALTDDPQIDASNLEITVKECAVTLSGTVTSRADKRRAEDIAESISGVKDVHNSLRVSVPEKGETSSPMSETTAAQPARH